MIANSSAWLVIVCFVVPTWAEPELSWPMFIQPICQYPNKDLQGANKLRFSPGASGPFAVFVLSEPPRELPVDEKFYDVVVGRRPRRRHIVSDI